MCANRAPLNAPLKGRLVTWVCATFENRLLYMRQTLRSGRNQTLRKPRVAPFNATLGSGVTDHAALADMPASLENVAAVGFQLADRVYGLDQHQAQFLAGQMRRRLTVPEPVGRLADEIWAQSMLNPDSQPSRNIELDAEQKRTLLEMLRCFTPEGDRTAWDALADALSREGHAGV